MKILPKSFVKRSIVVIALCILLLPPLGYALITAPLQVLSTVLNAAGVFCIGYAALILGCAVKEMILMFRRFRTAS